jgi:hypothetical protein
MNDQHDLEKELSKVDTKAEINKTNIAWLRWFVGIISAGLAALVGVLRG